MLFGHDSLATKLVLLALAFAVFALFQCLDVNKFIDSENEKRAHDYRQRQLQNAPAGMLIFIIVLLVASLFVPI